MRPADIQIKPLTEEEKKAKLAELRQKLAEKRAKQSKEEVQVNKANEALRRKAGQVSTGV
jgi:ribosomal protein L29